MGIGDDVWVLLFDKRLQFLIVMNVELLLADRIGTAE